MFIEMRLMLTTISNNVYFKQQLVLQQIGTLIGKMVAREIGKGTMIYGLHFTEQKLGVPKSMILVGDIVIIFGTNIVW